MAAGGKPGGITGEGNLAFLERVALDARVSSNSPASTGLPSLTTASRLHVTSIAWPA